MPVDLMTVRLSTADDLDALHARESHPAARHAQRHFERQQSGDYYFAVAARGDTVLGYCALDCDPSRELCPELMSLWVYPEHRRQGAAAALTRFLEVRATERGFVEVFLRVDPDNAAAIPMYVSLDYAPTGDHIHTTYETVRADGTRTSTEQLDAVYRKSLRAR